MAPFVTVAAPKLVVAAYFPWYGTPSGPTGHWVHWKDGNGNVLVKDHPPYMYDSREPAAINAELSAANLFGINAFAVSWWGVGSNEDGNLKILLDTAASTNSPVKLAAQFETTGLAGLGTSGVISQLAALMTSYSSHRSYLTVNGRPVVFIYNPAALTSDYSQWAAILANPAIASFNAMYIVDSFSDQAAAVFDGLYTFAPFGPSYPYDPIALYNKYQSASAVAKAHNKVFVPAVSPGFDDSVIRAPSMIIPRTNHETYVGTWYIALSAQPDWVFIDSWNEWHEATELEPSSEYGTDYLYLTSVFSYFLRHPGTAVARPAVPARVLKAVGATSLRGRLR
ncbi:MAG: glycoside hydrolase family 99-like domain-containing protein [Candidatus Dormibacteraeota bacterium]|nr:glycoside hydrolase family 99-like domain-containing protein [Candidatus Dormibacteraeota bacterium]